MLVFLSLRIYILWTFQINGIILYVTFCVWFLLLSIKSSIFMLTLKTDS